MHRISWFRMVFGLALLLAMCIPTFAPSLHELLHAHHHHACLATAGDTHMHAETFHCDLCDYLTSITFLYDEPGFTAVTASPHTGTFPVSDSCALHGSEDQHYLRGPPVDQA